MNLEERVIERTVIVALYELFDWGHFVEGDTPVMGAETHHGRYTNSYGHFSSLELAESAKLSLLDQAKQQGYERSVESDREDYKEKGITIYYRSDEDRFFQIKKKEANKKSIVRGEYDDRRLNPSEVKLAYSTRPSFPELPEGREGFYMCDLIQSIPPVKKKL